MKRIDFSAMASFVIFPRLKLSPHFA